MYKKMFVSIIVLILACGLASADPSIKFVNLTVDLGEITDGVKISTEFKFTNLGDKTLEINKVTLSCPSCSEAKAESNKIEPGESSKIILTVTPSNGGSILSKSVYVETNDPLNPKITLRATGKVITVAKLSAQSINFNNLPAKTTKDFIITLTPVIKDNFGISKVTVDGTHLKASYKKDKDNYQIKITLNTGTTIGRLYEKVNIVTTSLKGNPIYTIPIYGNILPAVVEKVEQKDNGGNY